MNCHGKKEEDVRVACEVDEDEIDDELDDLGSGDPFFPPDSNTTGCLEVVPVHDNMDCQVECDGNITLQLSDMELVKGFIRRRCGR